MRRRALTDLKNRGRRMTRILAAAALGCAVAMTQAAEYRLVKANDTSTNPYTEANAPTYWQTLAVRGTTYTLPICTCASDAPDLTEVFVPARIRGYTGRIEKVDAGGDRVRYQLVAEPSGLILVVR